MARREERTWIRRSDGNRRDKQAHGSAAERGKMAKHFFPLDPTEIQVMHDELAYFETREARLGLEYAWKITKSELLPAFIFESLASEPWRAEAYGNVHTTNIVSVMSVLLLCPGSDLAIDSIDA